MASRSTSCSTPTLKPLEETPGIRLAERLAPLIPKPTGMMLNTVEDPGGSGVALAWPSRPPHRDQPSVDVPAPTVLELVQSGK